MHAMRPFVVAAVLSSLSACGGGDVDPTPGPSPTSWPPLSPLFTPISPSRSDVVLVVVHPAVAEALRPSLQTLENDLRNEGWDPELQAGSSAPAELRAFFAATRPALRGAFLIGSIPYAECDKESDRGPCDLYLMDTDGEWRDTDGNGAFDQHAPGSGTLTPELMVGRLYGGNVSLLGQPEATMYAAHLARNHAYRTKALKSAGRALYGTIIDHHYGWYDPHSAVDSREVLDAEVQHFPDTRVLLYDQQVSPVPGELWHVSAPEEKRTGPARDLFLELLKGGLDFATIGGHGWHEGWLGVADTKDIAELARRGTEMPIMVDSHGCTTGGFNRDNSICSTMTMAGTLAFVGASVVTTSLPEWDIAFRQALGEGTIGEALARHHTYAIEWAGGARRTVNLNTITSSHRVLLGDPTLRLRLPAR